MKTILLLMVCLVSMSSSYASDIKVTAQAAIHPNNNGELLIEIDQSLGNAPFDISITGSSGYQNSQQIIGYTLQVTGLTAGFYCVQVVSGEGCVGNLCVEVQSCRYIAMHDTYMCSPGIEPCCPGDIVVVGTPTQPLTGGEDESDFLYALHIGVDSSTFVSLADDIIDSSFYWVNQILTYGSTEYDVTAPIGISDPDMVFALGYDSLGSIQWIWHDLPSNQLLLSTKDNQVYSDWRIYPNPGSGLINIEWEINRGQNATESVELNIHDLLGRNVHQQSMMDGTGKIEIDLHHLTKGIYFVTLRSGGYNLKTQRLTIH